MHSHAPPYTQFKHLRGIVQGRPRGLPENLHGAELTRQEVIRSKPIANLSDEAKDVARKMGLDDLHESH